MSEIVRRIRLLLRRLNMFGGSRTAEYDRNGASISGPPAPSEFHDAGGGRG